MGDSREFVAAVATVIVAFAAGAAAALWGYWLLIPAGVAIVGLLAVMAWRRSGMDPVPVAPNVVLLVLPAIIAAATISFSGAFFVTAFVGVIAFWMKRPAGSELVTLTWRCAILPVVGLVIVLRPNPPSTVYTAAFWVLGCIVLARAVYLSASTSSALTSLVDGIGLFLVASVVLRIAGFEGFTGRTAGLDNDLIGGERVTFPLSNSLTATPMMAAVYIAAVVPVLMVHRHRLLRLGAVGCGVYIIALADARASLVGALLLAGFVLLLPRVFRVVAPWIVTAALIVPFVYGYIQDVLTTTWLARPGEKLGTLNGRDRIWSRALTFYADRVDWWHQMVGYGSYGQAASGASGSYNRGFEGFGDRSLITPHNSVLQVLFDGGWLAAGVFAVTLVAMAWALRSMNLAGLSMLVALSIVGVTEVALSPAHAQPTWWILMALGVAAFAREGRIVSAIHDKKPRHSKVSDGAGLGGLRQAG